nr:hypothetical protein [uncultured Schaedlerella sp.]
MSIISAERYNWPIIWTTICRLWRIMVGILRGFCKKYGFDLVKCECEGDMSDFEPNGKGYWQEDCSNSSSVV